MTSQASDYRPLVRVRNLRFNYPGDDGATLVIPALDIAGSGLTALVGPSGAGKSTLVELLAGTLREPYEGTIETLGVDVSTLRSDADRQRHLRRIGFIPQDFGLLPGRTIREILDQDLADAQVPKEERAARMASAANAVGLTDFLDRQSNLLSGGQRQRAAVARMLARDVELVIADEPTANLDHERAREVLSLFRQIAASRPVIIVTHDPWLASECQRTVLLQSASRDAPLARPAHIARKLTWVWVLALVIGAGLVGGVGYAAIRLTNSSAGSAALLPATFPSSTPTHTGVPAQTQETQTQAPQTPPPPTPTPWPFPVQPESCGQLTVGQDASIGPVTCPDGRPDVLAVKYFQTWGSHLLQLGSGATSTQVMNAACEDLTVSGGGTVPVVVDEAQLAFAENNWSFPALTPDSIEQSMLNGGCSPATSAASASYATCQLYVPGKEALITVGGDGVDSSECASLIPLLHHNTWYLVSSPPASLPTNAVRCDVPASLLASGDSGVVTDPGEFSTATGDNACSDLGTTS